MFALRPAVFLPFGVVSEDVLVVSLSVSRPFVRRGTSVLGFSPRSSHHLTVFFSARSNFESSCLTLWLQNHAAPRTRRLSNSSPVLGLSLRMCLDFRVTRVAPVDPSPTSRTSPFFLAGGTLDGTLRSPPSTGRKTFRRAHHGGGGRNNVRHVVEGQLRAMESATVRLERLDEARAQVENGWEGKEFGGRGGD